MGYIYTLQLLTASKHLGLEAKLTVLQWQGFKPHYSVAQILI